MGQRYELRSQAKPSQAKPSQAKPSQAKSSQAKPTHARGLRLLAGDYTSTDRLHIKEGRVSRVRMHKTNILEGIFPTATAVHWVISPRMQDSSTLIKAIGHRRSGAGFEIIFNQDWDSLQWAPAFTHSSNRIKRDCGWNLAGPPRNLVIEPVQQ